MGERNWHYIPVEVLSLLEGYYNPKDYTLEPDSNPPFEVNIRVDCLDSRKLEYLWRLYAEKIKAKGIRIDEGWKIIFI
jgi:hypothetical protein